MRCRELIDGEENIDLSNPKKLVFKI